MDASQHSLLSSSTSLTNSFDKSSNLCQVVFHDIEESYATDSDIKARYTVLPGLTTKMGDRIGLYKVGWTSVSEYSMCIFAPKPEKANGRINFTLPVESLPKNEGQMYQICYVTSAGEVVAASIPFTFRVPKADELIAINDDHDPGLVVFKSRSALMQEELANHRAEYEMFQTNIDNLESKMSTLNMELICKTSELDKKYEEVKKQESLINDYKKEICDLTEEVNDLNTALVKTKQDLEAAELEKEKLKERSNNEVEVYEATISKMREELEQVKKERDNLKTEIHEELEEVKKERDNLNTEILRLKGTGWISEKSAELEVSKTSEVLKTAGDNYESPQSQWRLMLLKSEDEKALLNCHIMSLQEMLACEKSKNGLLEMSLERSTSGSEMENANENTSSNQNPVTSSSEMHGELIAELKSRVAVLEMELSNNLKKQDDLKSQLDRVKKNCDNLMNMTSTQYEEIQNLKKEKTDLQSQMNGFKMNSSFSVDHSEPDDQLVLIGTQKLLDASLRERLKLEAQIRELKKELVGKVSLTKMSGLF